MIVPEELFAPDSSHSITGLKFLILGLKKMRERKVLGKMDQFFLRHDNAYFSSNQAPGKPLDFMVRIS